MMQYFALCKFHTTRDRVLKTVLEVFLPRTGEWMTDFFLGLVIVRSAVICSTWHLLKRKSIWFKYSWLGWSYSLYYNISAIWKMHKGLADTSSNFKWIQIRYAYCRSKTLLNSIMLSWLRKQKAVSESSKIFVFSLLNFSDFPSQGPSFPKSNLQGKLE